MGRRSDASRLLPVKLRLLIPAQNEGARECPTYGLGVALVFRTKLNLHFGILYSNEAGGLTRTWWLPRE